MTNRYFRTFPVITYDEKTAIDLTKRSKIAETSFENPYTFFPYEIKGHQRVDNISNDYYEDPYYSWIVYFSNKIIDPYYDWYMNQNEFNDYIVSKYGSIGDAQRKVAFFRVNWYDDDTQLTPAEFDALTYGRKKYWTGITDYGGAIQYYVRKQVDWTVNTNRTLRCVCEANNQLEVGDQVTFKLGSNSYGNGEISTTGNTSFDVIKTSGDVYRYVIFTKTANVGTLQVNESVTIINSTAGEILGYTDPVITLISGNNITMRFNGEDPGIVAIQGQTSNATATGTITAQTKVINQDDVESDLYESSFVMTVDAESVSIPLGIPADEVIYWTAVSYYDYEEELNQEKANIKLLDSRLASSAKEQLKKLMKE